MKTLFLLLSFLTFSSADYLNISDNNKCIYSLTPYQNNTGWCYINRSDSSSLCDATLLFSSLLDGYEYSGTSCVLKNDLRLTGLTQNQMNYMLALLANFLGFTMFLLINYIAILIARR